MIKKDRTWMCAECFSEEEGPLEFQTEEEYKEHMREHAEGKNVKRPAVKEVKLKRETASSPPEKKQIKLRYKYEGNCLNCGVEVETIEIDVERKKTKVYEIAWCPACREKRAQEEVVRLK